MHLHLEALLILPQHREKALGACAQPIGLLFPFFVNALENPRKARVSQLVVLGRRIAACMERRELWREKQIVRPTARAGRPPGA